MVNSIRIGDSLRSRLNYEPQVLGFGTSGRRGKVVDLTQLEVYLNALAELQYLQSLPLAEAASSGAKILFRL
jgi:phosphomannomutase